MHDEDRQTKEATVSGGDMRWHHLRQVVLPALAPVDHEVGQPLFTLIHLLFAEGLRSQIPHDHLQVSHWQE